MLLDLYQLEEDKEQRLRDSKSWLYFRETVVGRRKVSVYWLPSEGNQFGRSDSHLFRAQEKDKVWVGDWYREEKAEIRSKWATREEMLKSLRKSKNSGQSCVILSIYKQ